MPADGTMHTGELVPTATSKRQMKVETEDDHVRFRRLLDSCVEGIAELLRL